MGGGRGGVVPIIIRMPKFFSDIQRKCIKSRGFSGFLKLGWKKSGHSYGGDCF